MGRPRRLPAPPAQAPRAASYDRPAGRAGAAPLFIDADHASGVVYCRDELELLDRGEWAVGTIQYWDDYVRFAGEWCFSRRRIFRWYLVDALRRPSPGAGVNAFGAHIRERLLPDAYPSWALFWDTRGV